MASRVPQGKGSKDRTGDRKAYDANYGGIRWPSRADPAKSATAVKPKVNPTPSARHVESARIPPLDRRATRRTNATPCIRASRIMSG